MADPSGSSLGNADRIEAARACDLLDTDPEAAFDRIVDLAAAMFGVPMAAVSVIDADREWFKARRGFDASEVPAAGSFGEATLIGGGELVVVDAARDRRFHRHPLVVAAPSVRFCAAVSVLSPDGKPVGAVCIMDDRPWAAPAADRMASLRALARLVEAELESRSLADRLATTTGRLRDLSEVASDWVWATDAEHRMVNLSSELPHMAKQAQLVVGKARWEFPESFPLEGTWEDHKAVLDDHREFRDFEYRLVTYLGERGIFRISGRPVFDRRGEFAGYRGIASNVTRLREHERVLAASEARYRNLVNSVVDLVFATDSSGRFTYASPAAISVLGVKAEDLIGRTFASVVDPADHHELGSVLHLARHRPNRLNTITVRGGGSPDCMRHVEVRFSASGEADAAGYLPFAGIIRDVEAQTVMEARLRDEMIKLRSIVESSGALILLVDRGLKIVLANHTFLEATGRRLDEVLGAPLDDVAGTGPNRGDMLAWLEHDGPERLAPLEFDRVIVASDGARRVLRVTASAVQDETGAVEYILFLGVDETERRSTEVQLLDAARLATIGQMATGMAHEINQPLTLLQFAVEGLSGEIADDLHRDDPEGFAADAGARLKRMEDQIRRASGIIRSLQGFAHRSDKAIAFDAELAITDAVGLVGEQMRLAGVDLVLEPTGALPPIAGQANRLQQVLINLMINARDALGERNEAARKVRGRIAVRAWREKESVVIEVADNGTGIPAEVMPRLFEPFFTTKPSGKGTGLGLSISSEIVRKMGGTIAVENRPEGGALFRVTLPVAQGA